MDAPKQKPFLSRRPVKYLFAVVAIALVVAAGWWMAGRKVWTDGRSGASAIRVLTADEDPRQVLWTPSQKVLPADFRFASGAGEDHLYEPALSPDGTELFFVRGKAGLPAGDVQDGQPAATSGADIFLSRKKNTRWRDPVRLDGVNSRHDDLGPRMTADGRFLLFYSNRPGGQGGYDLWAAARDDDGAFGEPFNLGAGVNSEFDEYGPAPSVDGKRLYFSTNRTAAGKEQRTAWRATIRAATTTDFDLWSADLAEIAPAAPSRAAVPATQPAASATQPAPGPAPTLLATAAAEVPGVNTPSHEGAPCVSPAGDFLYFASNRAGGQGKFDLYRSRIRQGLAGEPENLGPSINTADNETDPQLAHGGFKLYYSSDRLPEIRPEETRAVAGTPSAGAGAGAASGASSGGTASPVELADGRGRGYDLFETDSREVYPERQGRPLPVVGWAMLAMVAGALLLLPLLFLLVRNINRRNLTLLQRCFLAALCLYAMFLLWTTSKHVVMEAYPSLAADLGLVEVRVNLDPKIEESNVAMAIRQQSSSDLPVAAAPAGQLAQQVAGGEVIEAAPDVAVHVPQAAVGAEAMSVVVAAPRPDLAKSTAAPMTLVAPSVAPTPQPVDVKIDLGQRLQQVEAAVVVQTPPAPAAAPTVVPPSPVRPAAVPMPEVPSAQPVVSAGSLAQEIGPVAPSVPPVDAGRMAAAVATPAPGAAPAIDVPTPAGMKVAGRDAQIPAAAPPAAAPIQPLAGPLHPNAAPMPQVQSIPAAGAATGGDAGSMAAAPGVGAIRSADAAARLAGVAPNLPAGELVRNPEIAAPKMDIAPLAGGDPQTPVAGADHAVGMSRQDLPTGDLAGGAGVQSPLLPKLPTAGGDTPSMAGGAAPGNTANAIVGIHRPGATVRPNAAATQPAAAAGLGELAIRRPATQPSLAEPSLANAVNTSPMGLQPATRPADAAVTAGSAATAISAVVPAAVPQAAAGQSTLAATPATRPAGVAVAAAALRITGPVVGDAPGAAAMVASDVRISSPPPSAGPVAAIAPEPAAALSALPPAAKIDPASPPTFASADGAGAVPPATPAATNGPGNAGASLASATVVAPRSVQVAPVLPAPTVDGAGAGQSLAGIDGPQMNLPRVAPATPGPVAGAGQGSPEGIGAAAGGGPDGGKIAATRVNGSEPAIQRPAALSASVPGVNQRIGQGGTGGPVVAAGVRPGVGVVPGLDIAPNVSVSAPKLGVPDALFQRSVEQRRPMIEKLGGTKESEDAVERGLAWLARMQEPDGRWTFVSSSGKKSKSKSAGVHDMALTGLSVLAFLAADHSPSKEGPYQQVVAGGVDWIISQQTEDGDLRGGKEQRGAGSGRANMYDHGIATMAVAEAALMSGDRRYMDAALRAADYICDVQNKKTGGWRYLPGETGDTSVFGWQILALHNAELLGFQTPGEVRERSLKFLSLVSSGKTKILAGYTPGQGPTPPMTAEALFCRVLLDEPISDAQAKEVVEFLGRDQPSAKNKDLYYWYYMSLSMAQLQANPQVRQAWDRWNVRCRDTLIATQARGGDQDGSWTDSRWGEQGGKVYSTALATLTLEVYYRYLPLEQAAPEAVAAPVPAAPADPARKTRPRGPVGPKLEPN